MSDYGSEPEEIDDEVIEFDLQSNEKAPIQNDHTDQKEYEKFKKSYVDTRTAKKKGAPKKTITKADLKELQKFCKGKFIQNCSYDILLPLEVSELP